LPELPELKKKVSTMTTIVPNIPPQAPAFTDETRSLGEDVLQSAEDAVLSQPEAVQAWPGSETVSGAAPALPASPWSERLAHCVAEKPVQSALWALVSGAVLAVLIRSALQKRRNG
jgi:hypothetical protein